MLKGSPSAAINFDCILYHPVYGATIFELLQISPEAQERGVTPYNSHPNRYWFKNRLKFISLWNYTKDCNGKLFLINYAPTGSKYEEMVGMMEVLNATDKGYETKFAATNREKFSQWFRDYNKACREYALNHHVRT